MWILFKDGSEEIREIKYSRDLESSKVIDQIRIQKAYCEANNLSFKTITENELRMSKNLLSNYKLIIKNLKNIISFDEQLLSNIKSKLKNKPLTVEQLEQELFTNQKELISHIALLLFRGEVKADLGNGYFGKKLEVYIPDVKR